MIFISSISFEDLRGLCDLWTYLEKTNKPIVLYGMGDGADKVLDVCGKRNIKISGVFASDGFAKKKLFRGYSVMSYSEMCHTFYDFIVLLCFATQRQEVISNIYRISSERELYCPDVPVFGQGLFDSEYFNENYDNFKKVYSLLCDEQSKKVYTNVIAAKLTGKIQYLKDCETDIDEAYHSIIQPKPTSSYVDIGAYNGDTIREFLNYAKNPKRIYAFEPDAKNFSKLNAYALENGLDTSTLFNAACHNSNTTLTFYSRSGRNSAGTTSHKNQKQTFVDALRADSVINEKVDFINIDAEGSDANALRGLSDTIFSYAPVISCAVYHRNEDMFALPLLLYELYGSCRLYMRHFPYYPAWDTNVYAKPF